jgi:hypothetical protein
VFKSGYSSCTDQSLLLAVIINDTKATDEYMYHPWASSNAPSIVLCCCRWQVKSHVGLAVLISARYRDDLVIDKLVQ